MAFDADYPHAVDVPIPLEGLGRWFSVLADAASSSPGGAHVWSYSEPATGERRTWFNRIGCHDESDAARLATIFNSFGARRVR